MLAPRICQLWIIALFILVLSCIELPAQSSPATPSKATVDILVSAYQKDGSPATPTASSITVHIDKEVAQVQSVRSAKNDPLLFAVLVDLSGSNAGNADAIRNAVVKVFEGLAGDHNQGYLVLFSDTVAISRRPFDVVQTKKTLDAATFQGGTAVYDAIRETCTRQLSRSENTGMQRRTIIVISDGDDNASHIGHADAELVAEQEGVPVFSLVIHSESASHGRFGSASRGRETLKEISRNTGGMAADNQMDGVPQLLHAIDAQIVLTVVPEQASDRNLHSLRVKAEQKDIEILVSTHVFLP